jgi:hypothetical protein
MSENCSENDCRIFLAGERDGFDEVSTDMFKESKERGKKWDALFPIPKMKGYYMPPAKAMQRHPCVK